MFIPCLAVLHFRIEGHGFYQAVPVRFDGMHAVLERMASQIAREMRALDEESAQRRPGGHAHEWSAQQVIEHLVLSYRLTSRVLETRMKKGRPSHKQERTYLQWSLQLMILTFGALPRGVPSLPETTPTPDGFA